MNHSNVRIFVCFAFTAYLAIRCNTVLAATLDHAYLIQREL